MLKLKYFFIYGLLFFVLVFMFININTKHIYLNSENDIEDSYNLDFNELSITIVIFNEYQANFSIEISQLNVNIYNNNSYFVFNQHFKVNNLTDICIKIKNDNQIRVYYYVVNYSIFYLLVIMSLILILIFILFYMVKRDFKNSFFDISIIVSIEFFLIRMLFFVDLLKYNYLLKIIGIDEFYRDFEFWYLSWIQNFNINSLYTIDLIGYQYPPLLFIVLKSLHFFGLGLVVFSFLLMYLLNILIFRNILIKKDYSEDIINKSVLLFALNPFSLYVNFLIINMVYYVFFIQLSYYFWIREKYNYSMLSLGISFLFKQFIVLLFLLFIFIDFINKRKLKEMIKKGFYFFVVILIGFSYFLLRNFKNVINIVVFNGVNFNLEDILKIGNNYMINIVSFFVGCNFSNEFNEFLGNLLLNWFLFLFFIIIIIGGIIIDKYKFKRENIEFWIIQMFLVLHLFYPRGSFKYYMFVLIPFILLYQLDKENIQFDKCYISFLVVLIFPRLFYFNLLLFFMVIQILEYYNIYLNR